MLYKNESIKGEEEAKVEEMKEESSFAAAEISGFGMSVSTGPSGGAQNLKTDKNKVSLEQDKQKEMESSFSAAEVSGFGMSVTTGPAGGAQNLNTDMNKLSSEQDNQKEMDFIEAARGCVFGAFVGDSCGSYLKFEVDVISEE